MAGKVDQGELGLMATRGIPMVATVAEVEVEALVGTRVLHWRTALAVQWVEMEGMVGTAVEVVMGMPREVEEMVAMEVAAAMAGTRTPLPPALDHGELSAGSAAQVELPDRVALQEG